MINQIERLLVLQLKGWIATTDDNRCKPITIVVKSFSNLVGMYIV